jgi:hypothetical protein
MRGGYNPVIYANGGSKSLASLDSWTAFTPTGGWTGAVTYVGFYKKVNDEAHFDITVTCSAAPTGTTLTFNLPAGIVIDTAKLSTISGDISYFGTCRALESGVLSYGTGHVAHSTTTVVRTRIVGAAGSYTNAVALSATVPFTFGNTDAVNVKFAIPVVGW